MSELDTLLADMRRKYIHALEKCADPNWLKGDPITARILEGWIPIVERAARAADQSAERLCLDGRCTLPTFHSGPHHILDGSERLRGALEKIAAYDPGTFRPLADEIAIWRIAKEALGHSNADQPAAVYCNACGVSYPVAPDHPAHGVPCPVAGCTTDKS